MHFQLIRCLHFYSGNAKNLDNGVCLQDFSLTRIILENSALEVYITSFGYAIKQEVGTHSR